jgi:hypothetical protein
MEKTVDNAIHIIVGESRRAARSEEYYYLAGLGLSDAPRPYHKSKRDLQRLIGYANREIKAIQQLERHTHEWDEEDYCMICGADGRA